jgi:hypothetical protein
MELPKPSPTAKEQKPLEMLGRVMTVEMEKSHKPDPIDVYIIFASCSVVDLLNNSR